MSDTYTESNFTADLKDIYGRGAETLICELEKLRETYSTSEDRGAPDLTAATLICYADSVTGGDKLSPLKALTALLEEAKISEILPVVHLLPFFPWDTDRGFSVKDYFSVSEDCGSWDDIKALAANVSLMFDFVANHASVDNPLVQKALIAAHLLEDDTRYSEYFPYRDFVITFDLINKPTDKQIALLARPRAHPVLTRYVVFEDEEGKLLANTGETVPEGATLLGEGLVWTTFSRGKNDEGIEQTKQVDLNFKNPKVFLEVSRILLFYVEMGAKYIRLDAIGYIWKRLGASSLHEPEAHTLIRALSYFVKTVSPSTATIAEVNEPQKKAFTYLGESGKPECDAVYQFTHFPLALHALSTQNGSYYTDWLGTLEVAQGRQFTTVLGSHDGLGLKPVRGILPDEEIDNFVATLVDEHEGLPNYAKLPGGREIVYEVCGTAWQLTNSPKSLEEIDVKLAKYAAVLRLGFLVRGMPAIYINGLFGSSNFIPVEGLDENRTVNREQYNLADLQSRLKGEYHDVFSMVKKMLNFRNSHSAFHNLRSPAIALETKDPRVICCHLPASDSEKSLYLIQSLSPDSIDFEASFGEIAAPQVAAPKLLGPYEGFWFDHEKRFT